MTALEELLMWYELAWEFVADPEFATAAGNVPMYTYYLMQDKDWFVTSEQKLNADGSIDVPGNLATVACVAKTYISNYTGNAQLNTKVVGIDWNDTKTCVNVELNETGSSGTTTKVNTSKVRLNLESDCDKHVPVANKPSSSQILYVLHPVHFRS